MENYSVLMSVYKKENPAFLKLSVESILNQTYKSDDFIIMADGILTEELDRVLSDFEKVSETIKIIRLEKNVGLGNALNIGLTHCKNELVARMDSDDIALPDRCRLEVEEFEKNPELHLVGTFMEEFIDNPEDVVAKKVNPCSQTEIYAFAKRRNPFNHPTVMYKKSYILQHDGYAPLRKGQDFELFNRLVSDKMNCKNIPLPLLKFRRDKNANKRRKEWDSVKTNIMIIKKSWKRGYSSFTDYLYTVITQMALYVLPTSVIDLIYSKLYRVSE